MKLNRKQRRALNSNKALVVISFLMREAITDAKQKLNDVANNRSQNNE